MKKINLNIPVTIFTIGAILFLSAPSKEIFMSGLLIELIGITAGVAVFFRYKITEKCMKEI